MAIRIRKVNGKTIAVCAARTFPKEGDIYLDDSAHHALTTKFCLDWDGNGFIKGESFHDNVLTELMEKEEIEDNGYNEIKEMNS